MTLRTITHDPDATLDYTIDWGAWLDDGDTITAHEIIDAGDITVDSSSHDDTTVTVWISGGTVGNIVSVTCRITTAGGRIDDRTIKLMIRQR